MRFKPLALLRAQAHNVLLYRLLPAMIPSIANSGHEGESVSEAGAGWSDSKIIAALDTSASMLYRVRLRREPIERWKRWMLRP
jgi:hypothetical protein